MSFLEAWTDSGPPAGPVAPGLPCRVGRPGGGAHPHVIAASPSHWSSTKHGVFDVFGGQLCFFDTSQNGTYLHRIADGIIGNMQRFQQPKERVQPLRHVKPQMVPGGGAGGGGAGSTLLHHPAT